MSKSLSPRYNPRDVEDKWYQTWNDRGYFRPAGRSGRPSFTIVMPPPNVTGVLHLGHALNSTWQDILTRFHRMRGDNTLWLPGTDHAGIHTQMKVDELLRSQGRDRWEMGREAFVDAVWDWKEKYGGEILAQVAKLGASVDWSRLRFTLDEGLSNAVTEAFVRLYEEGLMYRGQYITNWCVSCKTALSDIEVEHQEVSGQLTRIRYPLADGTGSISVATTRPETMLGDTAIAVHPDDPRWRSMVGKTVRLPLMDRLIPVVADDYVDPEYGTGVVKVTPAHDPNDFAIGERHGLEKIKVIGDDGLMTAEAGSFRSMDRFEARAAVLSALDREGLIEGVESITHPVGHCEKCGSVIEPLLSLQWFVKVQPLVAAAVEVVKSGNIRFVPERFEKIYMNWMENLHDWCVSRQIWWGHRIPAYYCDACHETLVARSRPDSCPKCGGALRQDEDVLDTWFSSALWPFSTMGWPEETEDLKQFYPTSVLSTAYDIIFFWVSRMIMQGIHFTGQKPFDTVLLHGLVRDNQGRKMSKSLGNGVNPLEVVEKYGADALRIALVLGSAPGNDYRWSWERFEAGSHFANKVYNAVRFVLMNLQGNAETTVMAGDYALDRWIWLKLDQTIEVMTGYLERFEFGQAARAIYDFWWDDYCDWYIELAKVRLRNGDEQEKTTVLATLTHVAEEALKLLHPFMPFVTEELWQALPHEGDSIMVADWPESIPGDRDEEPEEMFRVVSDLIRAGRNLRAETNLPPSQPVDWVLIADDLRTLSIWKMFEREIQELLRAQSVRFYDKHTMPQKPARALAGVCRGGSVYLPLEGVVDLDRERQRLRKNLADIEAESLKVDKKLGDPMFVARAPHDVVEKARETQKELSARIDRLKERLEDLQ